VHNVYVHAVFDMCDLCFQELGIEVLTCPGWCKNLLTKDDFWMDHYIGSPGKFYNRSSGNVVDL
jgi:hypothetical protein